GRGYLRLAIDKKKKTLRALYNFNLLHEGIVMLKKMADEFKLSYKMCHIDKTALTDNDIQVLQSPTKYNGRVKNALKALEDQLPTFAIVDDGIQKEEKLYLLIERGSFWGMGYLPASREIRSL